MHETRLLRDLRDRIERIARDAGAARVAGVTIWIGALSHLSEEHLRSAWPELVGGTAAEGARLHIETSRDLEDARATGVVLRSVEVSDAPVGGTR